MPTVKFRNLTKRDLALAVAVCSYKREGCHNQDRSFLKELQGNHVTLITKKAKGPHKKER